MSDDLDLDKVAFLTPGLRTALGSIQSAWRRLASSRLDSLTRGDIRARLGEAEDLVRQGHIGEARMRAEEAITFIEAAW